MVITENISLASYTTFRIGGPARFFCFLKKENDVPEAVSVAKDKGVPFFVLGGGSNILVSDEGYKGLVMKNEIMGIEFDESASIFRVGAGENWDQFVEYVVGLGYYGIENLSHIPGVVGAAPVQNIGAYGTDVSSTVVNVRAFDVEKGEFVDLSNEQCTFGYRDSLFKKNKGRYIIVRVDFKLNKNGHANVSYRDLSNYFNAHSSIVPTGSEPTLAQVRDAIIAIRSAKLPDWRKWGTAGSFFKNPVIEKDKFDELKKKYPEMPGFPELDGRVKVALGWVLDKICNARGLVVGNVHTYDKQALVLVSMPGATASEVVRLSRELMDMVRDKTGIEIEAEVEWVN